MVAVKKMLWRPDEAVVQYIPADADNVNLHPFCLHLWRPLGVDIPMPPAACVGPTAPTTPNITARNAEVEKAKREFVSKMVTCPACRGWGTLDVQNIGRAKCQKCEGVGHCLITTAVTAADKNALEIKGEKDDDEEPGGMPWCPECRCYHHEAAGHSSPLLPPIGDAP
jgi:hypothetical protein